MDIKATLAVLPIWYAVFLLSLTCHEAAHAWAARRGGDDTAYLGGQVTLNPVPHVMREPLGTVIVPLLTYFQTGWMMGWASAPYDPDWQDRHPGRAAAMAAAGPTANFVLAALGFSCLKVGLSTGWFDVPLTPALDRLVVPMAGTPAVVDGLGRMLSILLVLNLVLLVFNAIPLPPMDGASVLAGIVAPARELMDRLRRSPMASLAGLAAAWFLFPYAFGPVLRFVAARLYG
ncbi:MAG: site-2 protease family protein [Acidobacteriia bacterium]|nr:site-2 protease family protein [Terriglobia bacterium]